MSSSSFSFDIVSNLLLTGLLHQLRIMTQFGDQLWYLQTQRHFPRGISHLFLLLNVVVMLACSFAVIGKRYPEYAVGGLLGVVVAQAFGYGLIFDLSFFLRNVSRPACAYEEESP